MHSNEEILFLSNFSIEYMPTGLSVESGIVVAEIALVYLFKRSVSSARVSCFHYAITPYASDTG